MIENQAVEIEAPPKDGRLAKYEKKYVSEVHNIEELVAFSKGLFFDCMEYLKANLNVSFPNLELSLMNHNEYTEFWDRFHFFRGSIPQTKGVIYRYGNGVRICIDLESHLRGEPIEFMTNLCILYLEELVHSVDLRKSEKEISEPLFLAIEGFLEIKLPEGAKEYRLKYAKNIDEINP